jgi:hypothetical protein
LLLPVFTASFQVLLSLSTILAISLTSPENIFAATHTEPVKSVNIRASKGILENAITRTAIEDVVNLLRKGFPDASVSLNGRETQITIILPDVAKFEKRGESRFSRGKRYNYLYYPDHDYEWQSAARKGGAITLRLRSSSFEGTAFGLYGLLQEKLGFKFYHPRRTIIPSHKGWPLRPYFLWQAVPLFDKKGFHIHTLHPTELAEQLNNPEMPSSLSDVKEYIDWLARNQQNIFQFYLLRDVDRARWIEQSKEIIAYAHKRGVMIGVEFSLSCLQQKAFQAIKLLNLLTSYKTQIDNTLAWLFQAEWDFVTVDFSMGEYMPNLGESMPELRDYLINRITEKYSTKVLYTTHIIQQEDCVKVPGLFSPDCGTDMPVTTKAGILIHTVMCYSIDEASAPVYGNTNQRFMKGRAVDATNVRETWYWPESAYWVTFDNSVPLLLLPYLTARWEDMRTMKRIGVNNHLTFSSGWEWGYWLIDWSIARWSWKYTENGVFNKSHPLSILYDLFPDVRIQLDWKEALALQNLYFKERGLMPLMSAFDPSAEMAWPFNKPFQPRLGFTYEWLQKKSTVDDIDLILRGPVASLIEYDRQMDRLVGRLKVDSKRFFMKKGHNVPELELLMDELTRGLQITSLRARHRALTLKALIVMREQIEKGGRNNNAEGLLQEAAKVRREAQTIVHYQEEIYRYPVDLLARPRKSLTAYEFGYLYPVSNLFFWWREEEQIRNNRFDAFYLNIWDFRRITGIGSMF